MQPLQRYYDSEEDFCGIRCNLWRTPCPHCGLIGALVLNGRLYGFDEHSFSKQMLRGRRVFCNNRKSLNNGCGRSFCILAAAVIKHFSISAHSLWRFLESAAGASGRLCSFRRLGLTLDESAAYRLWKRFMLRLSAIRTRLARDCPRPELPSAGSAAAQTIAHLRAVFKNTPCPAAAFQRTFGVSFL